MRGLIGPAHPLIDGICGTLKPGGELELLISAAERDGLDLTLDEDEIGRIAGAYAPHGLRCLELRRATAADVERLSSGWGRRLGIPERRPAWLIRLRLDPDQAEAGPG